MNWAHKISTSIVLGLLFFGTGCESLPIFTGENDELKTSGVVEVIEVSVAPELSARVLEVYAEEGDQVQEGEELLRLEDTLIQEERRRALAALDAAQANLLTAQTGVAAAQANLNTAESNLDAVQAEAKVELIAAEQAIDELYDTVEIARSQALARVTEANRAVREAQYRLDNFTVPNEQQDMGTMEALEIMKERLDAARKAFEPYKYYPSGDQTRKDRKEDLDEAQADYDSALRNLEYETALEEAQAALDKAMEDLAALQDGPDPDDIEVLESQIVAINATPKQAEAVVEQAQVGMEQAQATLEQAKTMVNGAQTDLELIDIQLKKVVIYSPTKGTVLNRSIEPGEVVQAGAPVMNIGQLDQLSITVYIPENSYGQIKLGEKAYIVSDSFPDEIFEAQVVRIADRAEYTPRNIQTKEDRVTTVFAIKLSVVDPLGKLKPGMPVDVIFELQEGENHE